MPLSRFLILVMPGKHLDKAGFMRAVDLRDLLADTAPVKHRINSRPVREASMKLSPMNEFRNSLGRPFTVFVA
ncbi:hypothetical protein MCOR02_012290 [Pyricularia oryzae]|nr:hypothetical protein MCOR01_003861 [Pyricularia oryzae]KAH9427387.1 hypothetical protein MCOR02_012290 [Pyricularia oryzae]KAI6253128.1 hypothetical protein MCOR19_010304 [Pyricularia oryzae]KAI6264885.1 hypothetical protein MCOR26_011079 [Pyricularia oryzae]KAI6343113.1 hypothetical protein MCOR28_004995 [Pyricularia oryzae]